MARGNCEAIRTELSARLDGEVDRDTERALEDHLETCSACRAHLEHLVAVRRALRARPAEEVPDLTHRIMARVVAHGPRARRRDLWGARVRVAGVAAAAAALLLVGTSIPFRDRPPESASAAEIVDGIRTSARTLERYRATFTVVERGWHPDVPVRRFVARVSFDAPERFSLRIEDRTSYPEPSRWPQNDVDLVANGARWWIREPSTCPTEALPGCAEEIGLEERSIVDRQPFDGTSPLPTDIVVPVETTAGLESLGVVPGSREVIGRRAFQLSLPYRQAVPLVAALQAGGSWREYHPFDVVTTWIDQQTGFPLRVEIAAAPGEGRRMWAVRNGYDDRAGETLLAVQARAFSQPAFPPETFAVPTRGIVKDGGFRPGPFARLSAGLEPSFLAGLHRYRAGTVEGRRTVLAYASGMTWLKVVRDRSGPTDTVTLDEEIELGRDGFVYYRPASESSPRRVDVYSGTHKVRLESNLPRAELLRIAASLPTTGRRLPSRISGPQGVTVARLDPESLPELAFALEPGDLPRGYRPAAALLSRAGDGRSTLTVYYRGAESEFSRFGIRVTQSRPVELLPPSSEEFVLRNIDGITARWSSERGELEWIDGDVYRAVAAPSFDVSTAVEIASGLR